MNSDSNNSPKNSLRESEVHICASSKSWMEDQALSQLHAVASMAGIRRAWGMPDLHPGRGHPIGAVFESQDVVYPHLIGSDIGCGIGLWNTDLKPRKVNLDRFERAWRAIDWDSFQHEAQERDNEILSSDFDHLLGTIGGGNHFAELQLVDKVICPDALSTLGICKNSVLLLVHSGSRGFGNAILRRSVEQCGAAGFQTKSQEFAAYLSQHNNALSWARLNRRLIADRMLGALRTRGTPILDRFHNYLQPSPSNKSHWLHRKGAAPSDVGPVVIPGSRGSFSLLVQPTSPSERSGWSLPHGAGRKWQRSLAKARLRKSYHYTELERSRLGSRVICDDRELLYEEAPEAYKSIEDVWRDIEEQGLGKCIALLKPALTFKVSKQSRRTNEKPKSRKRSKERRKQCRPEK